MFETNASDNIFISICKVKYRSYDTFNLKHENLNVFRKEFSTEGDYLWREVDDSAIEKLEKRMKVTSMNV